MENNNNISASFSQVGIVSCFSAVCFNAGAMLFLHSFLLLHDQFWTVSLPGGRSSPTRTAMISSVVSANAPKWALISLVMTTLPRGHCVLPWLVWRTMLPLGPTSAIRCNQTVLQLKYLTTCIRIVKTSHTLNTDCLTSKTQPHHAGYVIYQLSKTYVAAHHCSVDIWFDNQPLI